MILIHLPSRDVTRLRLASRSFANVVLSEFFWRSRFFPGREFHHVIEAHEPSRLRRGSWRQIFESVKALQTTEAMVERRRIWHLGLELHGILQTLRDVRCEGTAIRSVFESNARPEPCHVAWVTASRALKVPSEIFSAGSRCLFERELKLPPPEQSMGIFVSTVDLFDRRYISGITVLDQEGRSFTLGYRYEKRETLVVQTDAKHRLTGFCLAQDQRGIRGLAVIFQAERVSQWVGEHRDLPKRRLLTNNTGLNPVETLKGGFDVCLYPSQLLTK